MDYIHNVEAKKRATIPAFPTVDDIELCVPPGRRLRSEEVAAMLVSAKQSLLSPFCPVAALLACWQEWAWGREALSRCSDHLLADIGIEREDIKRLDSRDHHANVGQGWWRRLDMHLAAARWECQEQRRIRNEFIAYKDCDLDDLGIRRTDVSRIARSMHPVSARSGG